MNFNEIENGVANGGLNLIKKGATLNLSKAMKYNNKLVLELRWDVASGGSDFDLDASCFLLNEYNKVCLGGNADAAGRMLLFYNQPNLPGIRSLGDNLTGGTVNGPDETIVVDLSKLPSDVKTLYFVVTIHEAQSRGQTFKSVRNASVRLIDETSKKEIGRFNLSEDAGYVSCVEFCKMTREADGWVFTAMGNPLERDLNLETIFSRYV